MSVTLGEFRLSDGTYAMIAECGLDYAVCTRRIKFKNGDKSFSMELIEKDGWARYDHFDLLFKNSETVRVKKYGGHHAFSEVHNDCFVIYPYRAGIPFMFEKEKI